MGRHAIIPLRNIYPLTVNISLFYLLEISFALSIYNPKLKRHQSGLPKVKPSSFSPLLKANQKLPSTNLDHRLTMATNMNEIQRLHFFPKRADIAAPILTVLFTVSAEHLYH